MDSDSKTASGMKMAPAEIFEITVTGNAEVSHAAERAVLNVVVSSDGSNKAAVADEVITTCRHIETILRDFAPEEETPEAKAAASLAHWNKTSLSSTSHVPYSNDGKTELPRKFRASVSYDIRFKEFKGLGAFGTRISSLSHVEVHDINWILTTATEKSYRSWLRKESATDALAKAKDYCEVLGCSNVRPVSLDEDHESFGAIGSRGHRTMQTARKPTTGMHTQSAMFAGSVGNDVENEDLEFRPQEVKMSKSISIKFQADHTKSQ